VAEDVKWGQNSWHGTYPAVVITARDRAKLRELGRQRHEAKRPGYTRRKGTQFSDEELHEIGLYGECAVGAYLGRPLDERIMSVGDGGIDFTWERLSIAVKYAHRWDARLMVEWREGDTEEELVEFKNDLIVLAHGKCRKEQGKDCYCRQPGGIVVVLAGWLTRQEFMEKKVLEDLSLGLRHWVDKSILHPMHMLWDYKW
jgi:hypothetical protein